MKDFIYSYPVKVYFGEGAAKKALPAELAKVGKTVMLAYGGGSVKKSGVYDEICGYLKEAGKEIVDFSGIMPNPTYKKVQEGAALAKEKGVDFILAVGGGSVIDCCKIIAAQAVTDEDIWEMEFKNHVYADFAENFMAVPVIKGVKSANERFAGAIETLCIEAMMQDGKALQAGTSHFLGQNFAKAFDVTYVNKDNKPEYVWATSWGVSTRLMGALIMTHSDDNGLVLPPHLAPIQVVIVPIYKNDAQKEEIAAAVNPIVDELRRLGVSVKFDDADNKRPGFKFADYELKGVPVRLAIGARDIENGTVEVMRRDTLEKHVAPLEGIAEYCKNLLEEIQANIYQKALAHRAGLTREVDTYDEFKKEIEKGGFILAHWDGTPETEEKIKEETKATIRCIPFDGDKTPGVCMVTGKPSAQRVIFARNY